MNYFENPADKVNTTTTTSVRSPSTITTTSKPINYSVEVPSIQGINEGYVYSGMSDNGAVMATPNHHTLNDINKFSSNLFDPQAIADAQAINYLNNEKYSTLNSMGITTDPSKGTNFRPIGVDSAGQQLYSAQSMTASADHQLGAKSLKNTTGVINGFGATLDKQILDDQETARLQTIADNSQDPAVVNELDTLKQDKDPEGFIEKIFDYFTDGKASVTNKGVKEGKTKSESSTFSDLLDGAATAYQAHAMYQMWDFLSPAQKASGLVNVGVKAFDITSGGKLGKKVLVEPTLDSKGNEITPAFRVNDALQMFNAGINAYSLAKNWDQLSDVSRLVGGARTAIDMAKVAKSLNLLGKGVNSAAVAVNGAALADAGYKSVPHLGIGAMVGPSTAAVPEGYTVLSYTDDAMNSSVQGGKNAIIMPTDNIDTAAVGTNQGSLLNSAIGYGTAALSAYGAYQSVEQGNYVGAGLQAVQAYSAYQSVATTGTAAAGTTAAGATAGQGAAGALSGAQIAGGVAGIAMGAYTIYQGWGTGGTEGAVNGAIGGASMAAGLYMLGATNPFLLAGVVVLAACSGMIKTGKHEDQVARDAVRSQFKKIGMVDDNWNVELSDGSLFNIGIDGSGGLHDARDMEKISKYTDGYKGNNGKLHAYETDFTNDVAFMASLGGTTLARIISGGSAKNIDQMGGQLGNAFISNVDFQDGELTQEKWNKIAANQRTVYAKAGIKTKADGYALVNQLYAENRITDSEVISMHQSLNMTFDDNGWELALTLNSNRWNGIDVAAESKDVEDEREVGLEPSQENIPHGDQEDEELTA